MNKQDNNKDKLRVYEYAKSLNMSSKEIITILKRLNISVNNHMSVMENNSVQAVEKFFHDVKSNAAAKRAQEGGSSNKQGQGSSNNGPKGQGGDRPRSGGNGGQSGNRPAAPAAAEGGSSATAAQGSSQEERGTAERQGQANSESPRPQGEQPARSDRPQGQGQGGYNRDGGQGRPQGQGGGGYNRSGGQGRPQGQGGGGYNRDGGQGRPQGQGGGGYNRDGGQGRPQGQGGGYNRDGGQGRPQGQGGGYNRDGGQGRPQGQGGGGYNRDGGQGRPQGQGGGGYNRDGGQGRPQGQGGGYNRDGGQGRPQGQGGGQGRPGGQGGGGYNRDGGQGRPQGQGGYNRPGGQGGGRPQGQGGGYGQRPASSTPAPASTTANRPEPRRLKEKEKDTKTPARAHDAGGRPNRNAYVPGVDEMDVKANEGVASKRQKTGKRYDDRSGGRNNRNRGRNQAPMVRREKIDNTPKKIIVRGAMTVGEVAKLLHKDLSEVIKKLLLMGTMATINQELDLDAIQLLATEFGVEVELKIAVDEDNFEAIEEVDAEADLLERPPVVTIMGHVDHGKTTLLDAIRESSVTEGEAGGITQHIGAYQVEVNGKKITFLDTPGHEAFTSMRARGAQVTDITILVVAADDGVMPQTVEAINHAKAAGVPIIVAVNKIDKPGANPDKIKQELTEYELVPEEWGGDTIFVNISAKQRTNLEELLEMILLVSEVKELRANPDKRARGTVIEAELDKGKGPVVRVLIQNGTLKVGDSFIAGVSFGRVRAMVNDKGKRLKEAGPSTPVEITGLTEVPHAGDPFLAYEDERKARAIAERRASTLRQTEFGANVRVTLDDLFKHIQEGEIKDLFVIIKADVQGSAEALRSSLEKIDIEGVRVKIIHTGVGAITESDVSLASASNAIIIGFNVRPEPQAKLTADQEKVDLRLHRIIYNVIEEIEQAMKGMLDPVFKENIIGHAEVRNVFKVSKIGSIAGCMVTQGKISRSAEARLIRNGIVVYEGKIDSLKRFKDDAKDVAQGYECGITLEKYNDLKEGDVIEAFVMEKVER
ncbi:translation initiation factor IF-2 [Gorillibacterium sp. CAU 1737]|uniref:translation initiation factor IF-2 n=1 Tax=Gorillibacterium sp. CAU 1737 TaxID=3140362 RepID=UPI003260DF36